MEVGMDKQQTGLQPEHSEIRRRRREESIKEEPIKQDETTKRAKGIGLDIGTCFCVAATSQNNDTVFRTQRDAFFAIENNMMSKSMLNKLNANYIESEDKRDLYVIGNEALSLANFFNKECRRPLSKGVISTREKEALAMIKVILGGILGDPIEENEICHFSVPAIPIDAEYNVIYHENVLKSFVTSFGYKAIPMNEATAIGWAELEAENYTGIALSFGAGMVNYSLMFLGISEPEQQGSVARSGDWIDENCATACGLKSSRMTIIKESGIDLLNPIGREQTALKIYYENLIQYTCNAMEKKLNSSTNLPNFPDPITVILSGGTSKAGNFEKLFEQEIRSKSFPFKIKEVRRAKDQLNSVAKGCLLNSLNSYS